MNYNQLIQQQKLLKAYDKLTLISKGKPTFKAHPRLTYHAIAKAGKGANCFIDLLPDGSYIETAI